MLEMNYSLHMIITENLLCNLYIARLWDYNCDTVLAFRDFSLMGERHKRDMKKHKRM